MKKYEIGFFCNVSNEVDNIELEWYNYIES